MGAEEDWDIATEALRTAFRAGHDYVRSTRATARSTAPSWTST